HPRRGGAVALVAPRYGLGGPLAEEHLAGRPQPLDLGEQGHEHSGLTARDPVGIGSRQFTGDVRLGLLQNAEHGTTLSRGCISTPEMTQRETHRWGLCNLTQTGILNGLQSPSDRSKAEVDFRWL